MEVQVLPSDFLIAVLWKADRGYLEVSKIVPILSQADEIFYPDTSVRETIDKCAGCGNLSYYAGEKKFIVVTDEVRRGGPEMFKALPDHLKKQARILGAKVADTSEV
jgi:hypothetical protein